MHHSICHLLSEKLLRPELLRQLLERFIEFLPFLGGLFVLQQKALHVQIAIVEEIHAVLGLPPTPLGVEVVDLAQDDARAR